MTTAYTNDEAYTTYRQAAQRIIDGKESLKALRKEFEEAGEKAKYETKGTLQEKLAAIRTAVEPFKARIAECEAQIARDQKIADEQFDIWKGLK